MDGIPHSIWRDFPHPGGPNPGGREHVPSTKFEVVLARQILSCSRNVRSSHNRPSSLSLGGMHASSDNASDERPSTGRRRYPSLLVRGEEDIVGNSGHTPEMNDAFVELPVDGSASTDSSESEGVDQVHNPSFFSHRATVEDLIASFHRHTIGPLAGVDVRSDISLSSGSTPVIIISDAVSQRALDCALEKWRVEQEEKELEMRWRATKRVSENWLTKVELVRERHRARRERFQRERERGKVKAGGATARSLVAKEPATSQGNAHRVISHIEPHSLVQEPQKSMAPQHSGRTQSQPGSPVSHLSPSAPHSTDDPAFIPGSHLSHLYSCPVATLPTSILTNPSSQVAIPHSSPVDPKHSHAPYDPRMPGLALEDLAHIPRDLRQPSQTSLPDGTAPAVVGSVDGTESALMQEKALENYVQQYFDVSLIQMSQSPLYPGCVSASSDLIPPISLPPSIHDTKVDGDGSAHYTPQEGTSLGGSSSQLPGQLQIVSSHAALDGTHSPQSLASGSWLQLSHPSPEPLREFPAGSTTLHTDTSPTFSSGLPRGQCAQVPDNLGVNFNPAAQSPPAMPERDLLSSEPTAEEKMMWHVWSLTQSPLGTAADVILRNPQASRQSNLAEVFSKLFPTFKGSQDEAARVRILAGSPTSLEGDHSATSDYKPQAGTSPNFNWPWTSFPSTMVPLTEANALPMLAPRTILVNPAYSTLPPTLSSPGSGRGRHTTLQDQSTSPVPPLVPASLPSPVILPHDLPSSSIAPGPRTDSPISPASAYTSATALFTEPGEPSNSPSVLYPLYMPMGTRLFRIARAANTDVLRPSYWFEPDVMATERMRNVVNLMERSGGWRRPERRARGCDGDRKPREPDDLSSFDFYSGY